jgi:glycosyltransferase involved in cell wall biosynthesis
MTGRPAISVAICLYNSARFIDETLESVFAQTFRDYEIILLDDGSTDGCADAIERRHRHRRLNVIRQRHHGLAHARRRVISLARGDFVAFLDHDDVWLPDKLERQITAADQHRSAVLFFSDCMYIDEQGACLGRVSDQYALDGVDLTGTHAYAELLRRGCFIWQSTVFARTAVLRAEDSFDPQYPYIADYDTWLRIARQYAVHYTAEVLAKWRVHQTQFTNRCPDVTLADHDKLLGPLVRTASIPESIRTSIAARVCGQHVVSCGQLLKQKRFGLAARAVVGMCAYPDHALAYCRKAIAEEPLLGRRLRTAYRAVRPVLRGVRPATLRSQAAAPPGRAHVWIDGSVLDAARTGYFSLVSELIRTLVICDTAVVHVVTSPAGERTLGERLKADVRGVLFHRPRRVWNTPHGSPPHPSTIEVLAWRGRYRWAHSRHVALVPDLTTKIHPELHTPENVAEFDDFLSYVQRHAHNIVTLSEHSRRDILKRLAVFPDSVSVMPVPLHPFYVTPQFDRSLVAAHGVAEPYLLCVGTIEPRKNLRRLVTAFERSSRREDARDHLLVFAGPQGWDNDFARFVSDSEACSRIRMLGFVPIEHLPSLYHFASAVVYPSLYEGFGLPVLEAMACSGIVLTSSTTSLPEVIGDGLTFDPHDINAIAAAISHALSMSTQEQSSYRRRCRSRAELLLARATETASIPGVMTSSVAGLA